MPSYYQQVPTQPGGDYVPTMPDYSETSSTVKIVVDGLTRKLKFAEVPSYRDICERLQQDFGVSVPVESMGLMYVDADFDEVRLLTSQTCLTWN